MTRGLIFGLVSILALGACSHYSEDLSALDGKMANSSVSVASAYKAAPQDIAPAAGETTPGQGGFTQFLAREYYDLARYENDKAFDYKASKNFTNKAMAAAEGKIAAPSKVSAYDIPAERAGELNTARADLINALKTQNTPENAATLARAQCRYECWLERAEEADDSEHYSACKQEFEAAMAALTMPAAGTPTIYDISFAKNSAIIDPVSANTIELVAQFLKDPKNATYGAQLMGFGATDTAPQNEYAMNLATARINAVRDALVAKGIDSGKLKPLISPAVMTADATQKVEVMLIGPEAGVTTPYSTTTTTFTPVQAQPVPAPAIDAPAVQKQPEPVSPKTRAFN